MFLIAVKVEDADNAGFTGTVQAQCNICGEEVYTTSSYGRLRQEYDIDVICTACISRKGGLMAHKRLFDPKFFNKHKTIQLRLQEKYLYLAMKAHADDDGRLIAHPAYLQTIAFLYDNISINKIRAFRDHVVEVDPENLGLMLYKYNDAEYIVFRNFKDEQKPKHYVPSELPPPPDEDATGDLDDDAGTPEMSPESAPDRSEDVPEKGPETAPKRGQNGEDLGEISGTKPAQKGGFSGEISAPKSSQKVPLGLGEGLGGELINTHTSYLITPRASQGEIAEEEHISDRKSSPEEPLQIVKKSRQPKKSKNRMKPHQKQAGIFLDFVEKHKSIKLVQREKLLHIVRKLFWIDGTTPEKLLDCFRWLEEHDLFCRGKEPPLIIGKMPDKYPSWLQGKLPQHEPAGNERRPDGKPGKDATKARRKPVEPIESGPDIEPAGNADGGNSLSDMQQNLSGSDQNIPALGENDGVPTA